MQPGLAKTAFGYSANEVMQQLGNPQQPQQPQQPYQQPQQPYQAPRPQGGSQPPPVGGPPYGQPGGAPPSHAASAATIMVAPGQAPPFAPQGNPGFAATAPAPAMGGGYQPPGAAPYSPPNQGGYGAPQGGYGGPSPMGTGPMGGGMGIHSPPQPTPQPLPTAQPPPYLASQTAARAGRPIEPWKDSLRFMMFVWGAVALAAFATPVILEPLGFNWDLIIDGEGKQKIPPLLWAAAGAISLAAAAMPMMSLPRGIIAAVLGLAGWAAPIVIEQPDWQIVVPVVGMIVMIPGLFLRHEYTESLAARIMITVGVVATLLPLVIPNNGEIPLVATFKGLLDAEGKAKLDPIMDIVKLVVIVMTLLAWMPGPATGGAKVFAWIIILFPVLEFVTMVAIRGGVGDAISKAPGMLLQWVPFVVYSVLIGYGGATVIGKQLE